MPTTQQATAPEPVAPAPRRRRRILAAAGVAAVVAAGALVAHLTVQYDQGRFTAEPSPCETITPSVPLLGARYTLTRSGPRNCELRPPQDSLDAEPRILVGFLVTDADGRGAPQTASRVIRQLSGGKPAISGVGDEAYALRSDIYLRVSNLVVAISVDPTAASTPKQVRAFAIDLATRLDASG